jgi:hypothetical protein
LSLLHLLLAFTALALSTTAEARFPRVNVSWEGSVCHYDAGDMHAFMQKNGPMITWNSLDGKQKTWLLSPEFFQDQVLHCIDGVECSSLSSPCYGKCIRSLPYIHLYDSRDKEIIFSVELNIGSNVPLVVFTADLEKRKAMLLFETYGSELRSFVFSPSQKSIAFLAGGHGSACNNSAHLKVFDMQKKILAEPAVRRMDESAGTRENVFYESISWIADSQLRLKGRMWNCRNNDAVDEIPIEGIAILEPIN